MGGHALSRPSDRITKEEYEKLYSLVIHTFSKNFPAGVYFSVVKAYNEKESFGDMDILVSSYPDYNPLEIPTWFNALEIKRNGDCTSFGINFMDKFFQIDLIKTPLDCFEFAERYFAFNDLGNMIGRIAHKMGFKFGHHGLNYVLREPGDNTHVLAEIPVTKDFYKALTFLYFDTEEYKNKWETGFKDLPEIFEYVIKHPYFNPAIYLFENLNHTNRVRDRKRVSYNALLKYIEENCKRDDYFDWETHKDGMRNTMLTAAFCIFPEFHSAHEHAMAKWELSKAVKAKFNGHIISEITGLQGKELGAFIQKFKSSFSHIDYFNLWVLQVDQEIINATIKEFTKSLSK